jgi:hypothetical protein
MIFLNLIIFFVKLKITIEITFCAENNNKNKQIIEDNHLAIDLKLDEEN